MISELRKTPQVSIIENYATSMEYEMMSGAYCLKDRPFTRPLKTLLGFNNWEERTDAIKQLEGDFSRCNLQYDNREIVQQLRNQRRDQLQRDKSRAKENAE